MNVLRFYYYLHLDLILSVVILAQPGVPASDVPHEIECEKVSVARAFIFLFSIDTKYALRLSKPGMNGLSWIEVILD